MLATKNDLIRFLTLIKEGKIDLEKDLLPFKDYKDYWLMKEAAYYEDPVNNYLLDKDDWVDLKVLLDSNNFVHNKELEKYWDEQIKYMTESRKEE